MAPPGHLVISVHGQVKHFRSLDSIVTLSDRYKMEIAKCFFPLGKKTCKKEFCAAYIVFVG